jgi:hypothetical protein
MASKRGCEHPEGGDDRSREFHRRIEGLQDFTVGKRMAVRIVCRRTAFNFQLPTVPKVRAGLFFSRC